MRLRTDDDIYRARLVYLGPPGYTLPVQLPYAQYGVFVVLVPLFMLIHYLFTLHVDLFPAWEIALAIVTTSFIFRHVDPDLPARKVIRTALTDWRTTREPAEERREARLVARRVHVREAILAAPSHRQRGQAASRATPPTRSTPARAANDRRRRTEETGSSRPGQRRPSERAASGNMPGAVVKSDRAVQSNPARRRRK